MHNFQDLDETINYPLDVCDKYRLIKFAQHVHNIIEKDGILVPFSGELKFNAYGWHWDDANSCSTLILTVPDFVPYEEMVDCYIRRMFAK